MHTPSEIQYSTVIACVYDRYIFNIIILIFSYQIYSDYVYYCILRNSCQMHFEFQNFEHHHKTTGWNTLEHIHTQVLIVHLQVRDTQRQIQGLLKPWEQDAEKVGSDHFYHLWRLQLFRQEASHMVAIMYGGKCLYQSFDQV